MDVHDIFEMPRNQFAEVGGWIGFPPFSWQLTKMLSKGVRPPRCPGVYVFGVREACPRRKGESDIMYIGSTSDLRSRTRKYVYAATHWPPEVPSRGPEWRIASLVAKEHRELTLGWLWEPETARAQSLETYLLNRYEADHGELPPLNVTAGRDVSIEPRFIYPWEHTHGRWRESRS